MRAILTYHSIDSSGSPISVDPLVFDGHVRWLASGRVPVVGLSELLALPDDMDAVALTFDDAFANFATEAWPRLRAHNLPVTLYVPTRFVGTTNRWAEMPGGRMPPLPLLDWPVLARLHEDGLTLGAHSRTHPDLRALDPTVLEDEVLGSIDDIQREAGARAESFAYPYGYWNTQVAAVVRSACNWACTTDLRPLGRSDENHLLPRLDAIYLNGPGRLEHFGRPTFRRYVWGRAWIHACGQWVRARRRA
jgi:peptidoglycan/xylan/chitin deacetylase (PgdA/CDA1 family)